MQDILHNILHEHMKSLQSKVERSQYSVIFMLMCLIAAPQSLRIRTCTEGILGFP